jgi:hypothetical protein
VNTSDVVSIAIDLRHQMRKRDDLVVDPASRPDDPP